MSNLIPMASKDAFRNNVTQALRALLALCAALLLVPSCSPLNTTIIDKTALVSARTIRILPFSVDEYEKFDYKPNADSLGRVVALQLCSKFQDPPSPLHATYGSSPGDSSDLVLDATFQNIHRGGCLGGVSVSIAGSVNGKKGSPVLIFQEEKSHSFFDWPFPYLESGSYAGVFLFLIFFIPDGIMALAADREKIVGDLASDVCEDIVRFILSLQK